MTDDDAAQKAKEKLFSELAKDFDFYDGDLLDPPLSDVIPELEALVPDLTVGSAGGYIPVQSEGILKGLPYYFRYRGGVASLKVGPDPISKPLYMASMEFGHHLDGILSAEEFKTLFVKLVKKLDKAPFMYRFEGKWVDYKSIGDGEYEVKQTDEKHIYGAWGHSSEEAYERLTEVSEYLVENGIPAEDQLRMTEMMNISPESLDVDDREFPDPAPVFEVS